jgi:hypothetical protein
MKLQFVGNRYTLTVPKEIVDFKHWEKGQKLIFSFDKDGSLFLIESNANT